jgi:glycogen debranching enzyme
LAIDADVAGTLAFSFMPRLQPQWPAALGGVAAAYKSELGGFQLSEPSARVASIVGSPWATKATEGIQYYLPNGALRLEIPIEPVRCREEWLVVAIACSEGDGAPDKARQQYLRLLRDARPLAESHAKAWEARAARIPSIGVPFDEEANTNFREAFRWNAISLEQGLVRSDTLGDGLVAGYGPAGGSSGRPGFAWYFTGDVSVNAPAYLAAGFADTLKVGLRFAARHQRRDGKIPHEVVLSAPLCGWFDKYPFAYIHGETTGLWIHACRQALDWTGDRALLDELWDPLVRAHRWILAQDADGDGLPDNAKAGMGASEIGALRANLRTDIYLASASAVAMRDIAYLASIRGDAALADEAKQQFEKARLRIANAFWSEADHSYAHALLDDGSLSRERTVWPAVAVMWELVDGERAAQTMQQIDAPALTTSWGVRFLSSQSQQYDPKGYNSGAVWPFVTGLASLADFEAGRGDAGFAKIRSIAGLTFAESLGRTPEVLSGSRAHSLEASVPHQLFSSMSVVAPTVLGLLGYRPEALSSRIRFRPCFPDSWGDCRVEAAGLRYGAAAFDIACERKDGTYRLEVKGPAAIPRPELAPRNGTAGAVTMSPR